ncbi:MAG: tetratricopeptide repeat protein [Candidatus Competibacteraceae bacterium]
MRRIPSARAVRGSGAAVSAALVARAKVLGPEHPATLRSVNNLAVLYQRKGGTGKWNPLYQRALVAREKMLNPEHPETLNSVHNLAFLYGAQGRYKWSRCTDGRWQVAKKYFGPEYPDTLHSVYNLASLYGAQGRYEEAELLYQQALATREKVPVPSTLRIPDTQLNYAVNWINLKQPKRALQFLERMEPRL